MGAFDVQTYVCKQPTSIYESPAAQSPVAEGGNAKLEVGEVFVGKPDENDTIWISTGVGFVPKTAVSPAFLYQITKDTSVHEGPSNDAAVAVGGSASLRQGEQFAGAPDEPGWIWMIAGTGFVNSSAVRPIGVPAQTIGGGEALGSTGEQTYTVQPGDSLSLISQKFYGSQAHVDVIYERNRQLIGDDKNLIYPGQQLAIPPQP